MEKTAFYTFDECKRIYMDPKLMIAAFNIPISEVEHSKNLLISLDRKNEKRKNNNKRSSLFIDYRNEWELRRQIAWNRWANPLCSFCRKKGRHVKLWKCGRCLLHFYCSKECQLMDWKIGIHKDYCCNRNHIYDAKNDPYAPVICRINNYGK